MLAEEFFYEPEDRALAHIRNCAEPVRVLTELTRRFGQLFTEKKRQKNLLDFGDMEHFALDILVKKEGEKMIRTAAAEEFSDQFAEILIDEYQDSNLVQELLLTSVSRDRAGRVQCLYGGGCKTEYLPFPAGPARTFYGKV